MSDEEEPILDIDDIQGNILAGFKKNFENLLFLKIIEPEIAKQWIKSLQPQISSLAEVLSFNNLFKILRTRLKGEDPHGLAATWINIAFSYEGLKKLCPEDIKYFGDEKGAFRQGMAARYKILGDSINPEDWVIGGPNNASDIILIVASDNLEYLNERVNCLKETLQTNSGIEVIHEDIGRVRSDMPGHEHFGFKDGISQPGIRGLISEKPNDYLTPRLIDPTDELSKTFSRPGEPLIWPGEFVFGYPAQGIYNHQKNVFDSREKGLDMISNIPKWGINGSFLVFRRLRQDVKGFRNYIDNLAKEIGISSELLQAKFMGRWPSGAPIMRSPEQDDLELGKDEYANNHFAYINPVPPINVITSSYTNEEVLGTKGDLLGKICPIAAHIRKVNPRDFGSEKGAGEIALTKRILRRGIPYGVPYDEENPEQERGLLFLCYQTSIEDQFEFIQTAWANQKILPGDGGEDPIIGQNEGKSRTFKLTEKKKTLDLMQEWVTTTGGGYFFQPSISAIKNVLAKTI